METSKLKKFAQLARRQLMEQVTAKLKRVLAAESPARRERPEAVAKLEEQIKRQGEAQVVERVAYTWFNRFCALRFMDVNGYNRIGVVSPAVGQFQPEILAEAKMGYVDEAVVPAQTRQQILALLDGTASSPEPQAEAYRLLVVAVCNDYHRIMPYLFERIDDYTELLMPDDLLSGNSILAYTREAMTPNACEDVEVIGWLYQFYISEKKDEVFAALKKNKKITPENIPAATQLFTPNWIVRYLVENSLGRLWLLNRPGSKLVEQMDYYIKPEQAETDFLRVSKPEEIKICDPACGSGHMLTYAFDLLYAIYEEEGYEPAEIPEKILTHNLYGVEIDERAGELAAFALTMKAREKQRRFFRKPVQPNICVLESIRFEDGELKDYLDFVGRDLFTAPLRETLHQFREADNFGSLIRPAVTDVGDVLALLKEKDVAGQLFLYQTHQKVLKVLRQADFLSSKYHVVAANPPYMGGRGMNGCLSAWAKQNYPDTKSDLFAMFMERTLDLILEAGYLGMINLPSWLFLSTFTNLRNNILNNFTIETMLHMGRGIFGIDWGSTAFVIQNKQSFDKKGHFFRLHKRNFQHIHYKDIERIFLNSNKNHEYTYDFDSYRDEKGITEADGQSNSGGQKIYYKTLSSDFKKIPESPIAYWVSPKILEIFFVSRKLKDIAKVATGLQTGDNDKFLRIWFEVSKQEVGFSVKNRKEAQYSNKKWFPYNKGGDFRKWYGNQEYLVNWKDDGSEIRRFGTENGGKAKSRPQNTDFYFQKSITWSFVSSACFGARFSPEGFIFDVGGSSLFASEQDFSFLLCFLSSKIAFEFMKIMNPTLNFQVGNIANIPVPESKNIQSILDNISSKIIGFSQKDWDSYELSWDFEGFALLQPENWQSCLKIAYTNIRWHWAEMIQEMQRLEEENNRIFIEAYGLQDELTPEVPLSEITLTCNPHYRYGGDKTEAELEALLLADTMREFISYAVGCMFGRYALDNPGLILANQGETIEDYRKLIPNSTFPADEDNVIPMLDGDWFPDDIAERFRKFLRVTFGEEHYEENLKFLENAIGKDIRKYFLRDFYPDHLKRYKKRPIYWLFSSPKGTFNALIYMHRYRPDTVSIVLNDYLREFRTKLTAHKAQLEHISISTAATAAAKTKALKDIEALNKNLQELDDYEREVLYPLATEQVQIDLDDGVKVNYPKFGKALKPIPGLT